MHCVEEARRGMVRVMNAMAISRFADILVLCGWAVDGGAPGALRREPPAAAVSGFNAYVGAVEARLARQHGSRDGFLGGAASMAE